MSQWVSVSLNVIDEQTRLELLEIQRNTSTAKRRVIAAGMIMLRGWVSRAEGKDKTATSIAVLRRSTAPSICSVNGIECIQPPWPVMYAPVTGNRMPECRKRPIEFSMPCKLCMYVSLGHSLGAQPYNLHTELEM
jgi:hypothetical protein